MTWVLVGLFALIAVPVLVGFLMPSRYEGRTTLDFDHGAQEVWDALQDVRAHPMTGPMMKEIGPLPAEEGRPAWTEDMGRGEIITVTTVVREPPKRLSREMSSASVNMRSRWDYDLKDADASCRVTLTGVTHIERGTWHTPFFRVMMVLGGGVKKGLDTQLAMVRKTLDGPIQEAPP